MAKIVKDAELTALHQIGRILDALDAPARRRVVSYLLDRHGALVPPGAEELRRIVAGACRALPLTPEGR